MRSGDRVRITAQLIQATTDRHLWAESYERDLRDVLALQERSGTGDCRGDSDQSHAAGARPDGQPATG